MKGERATGSNKQKRKIGKKNEEQDETVGVE